MWEVILYTFISGVAGTGLGGFLGVFLSKWSNKIFAPMMALSGGIMVAISVVELLPDAIELGGVLISLCGLALGVLIVMCLTKFGKKNHSAVSVENQQNRNYLKMGIMICFAIGIHNLPEGLVIGSSQVLSNGLILAIIICLHNIPEGISMTMPLCKGGTNKFYAVALSCLSGLPTVLGGVIGYMLGSISNMVIATCYALACGTMLYISFDDVFKTAYSFSESKNIVPIFALIGLVVGAVICLI